ncbi:MAG TPA: hypothetical protein VK698_05395 [Kofleriaceae bacterium]|nr:hypothetical protein [Kofleriaceae bacterium]
MPAAPVILEGGSRVTRVSLDGRKASPDLSDDHAIVRLGVAFDDHGARIASDDIGYASPGADPLLPEVRRGVIRYDGAPASYVVLCEASEETHAYSDGTERVCRWCAPFVAGAHHVVKPGDSCPRTER